MKQADWERYKMRSQNYNIVLSYMTVDLYNRQVLQT